MFAICSYIESKYTTLFVDLLADTEKIECISLVKSFPKLINIPCEYLHVNLNSFVIRLAKCLIRSSL